MAVPIAKAHRPNDPAKCRKSSGKKKIFELSCYVGVFPRCGKQMLDIPVNGPSAEACHIRTCRWINRRNIGFLPAPSGQDDHLPR